MGGVVPASGAGAPHVLGIMNAPPPRPAKGPPPAAAGALHVWPIGHSVSEEHCCVCVAVQLDWQVVLGKKLPNIAPRPPNPPAAAASDGAGIEEPPSADPEQHTCPEEQSAPVVHSFKVPAHDEPTGMQEADSDGIITTVQHAWPAPHFIDPPSPPPPPPPPAPGSSAAKPESGPQVTPARRFPIIPRGLAALESSLGLTVVFPSSEEAPPSPGVFFEEEEPHAATIEKPKKAITPRESRAGDMRISKVGLRPR
nr:hypothetical protein Hi04_10k_c4996_00027 [uncultured bacterium]